MESKADILKMPLDQMVESEPALDTVEADSCTDTANAKRFVSLFGHDLKYVAGMGWHYFDQSCWKHAPEIAELRAQDIGRHIREESIQYASSLNIKEFLFEREHAQRQAESLLKWAKSTESRGRIEAILELARSHLTIRAEKLDADPWLFNCSNGTINLRTGDIYPARREDLLTKCSPIAYDQTATNKLWERTVLDICRGDKALMSYIQRVLGYCMTGSVREQVMFLFNGTGANGKDTILGRVMKAFGDYGGLAAPGLLMQSRGDRHPTEVADLRGMRLTVSSETGEQGKMNETLVKQLTGSEVLKGRLMRQDFFQFQTQFKLILMTNHRPAIEGTDFAIWRRIHLIPFNARYVEGVNRDKTLPDRLDATALPAVLNWCVQGCLEWQKTGLQTAKIVREATNEYKRDQDILSDFLDDCCDLDRTNQVTAKAFYARYVNWCEQNGEQTMSQKWLSPKLQDKGVERERISSGYIYRGIGLKQEN